MCVAHPHRAGAVGGPSIGRATVASQQHNEQQQPASNGCHGAGYGPGMAHGTTGNQGRPMSTFCPAMWPSSGEGCQLRLHASTIRQPLNHQNG